MVGEPQMIRTPVNQNRICQTSRDGTPSLTAPPVNIGWLKKLLPRMAPGPNARNVQINGSDHFAAREARPPLSPL
jgi:hypothetical protein